MINAQVEQLAGQVQCKGGFRESIAFCKLEGLEDCFLAYKEASWKAV